ncbi:MAG: sigma-54-dependent Fis family transcriptional regulator [Phycisphaeraceae bacterium]|nr:sigma-54-dependent Fis family transcriptional regulator [Phycisphaeraceae bacterium]
MTRRAEPDRAKILVVDDDPVAGESLAEFLQAEGYETATALNGEEALSLLAQAEQGWSPEDAPGRGERARPFGVVVSDVAMPGIDGLELLARIGKLHPSTAVLMLTGYGTIESAVEAVRRGAVDYLTKPVIDAELRIALERALRQQALLAENRSLRGQLEHRYGLDNILGADHRMVKTFDLVEAVAPSKTTVLMTGESGTGKSLIAHAIHHRSPRKDKAYVEISCGSIPETLLESELFGHMKGAFTGAFADKVGKFLAADGGTIFLDEINSASPGMQLKLLRVLQERRFEPVGSNRTIEVDVRVVLASNQPLERLVEQGLFRQDLYYRINVVKIELPPLRDRLADIPLLAAHFLRMQAAELGKQITGFTPEAVEALRRYTFPGNVRELQNIVERGAVLTRSQTIGVEDLPEHLVTPGVSAWTPPAAHAGSAGETEAGDGEWTPMPLEQALREPERRILLRALAANSWNRQKTAEQLEINRTTLYKKMKLLGIESGDRLAG